MLPDRKEDVKRVPIGLRIDRRLLKVVKMYALINGRRTWEVVEECIITGLEERGFDLEDCKRFVEEHRENKEEL